MFTDHLSLSLEAGRGGNGVVAWRREKYIPKGGPVGGDGGQGGSVYFQANSQILSLEKYRHRQAFKAENGHQGGSNHKTGRDGEDLILQVPCGTIIKDSSTGEIIKDLTEDQELFLVCNGGKGGKGNRHFATPTRQAPNFATEGKDGEFLSVNLELKLIADIGLVGMPNAGKSTFMKAVTHANVKIAAYPFTTLRPNLGVMHLKEKNALIADIPGLIPDAHLNKGLGISFLKHIERTSILLFFIDIGAQDGRDPVEDFFMLQNELKQFNPALIHKPFLIALNKIDIDEILVEDFIKRSQVDPSHIFPISAQENMGLEPLKEQLEMHLCSQRPHTGS